MDLHARLEDWIVGGAEGDPPRDVALHASTCDECLRLVAAFESLVAIDVGAAPAAPAWRAAATDGPRTGAIRLAVGGVAAVLLVASALVAAPDGIVEPARSPVAAETSPPSIGGDVLSGVPTDEPTNEPADPSPTPRRTERPSPTGQPTNDEVVPVPTFPPAIAPPLPAATAAPVVTPVPTIAPTPAPTPPPPPPPPPTPTAVPTVVPTPPPPDDCANGLDDDLDGFIDDADLGCVLTGDEAGDPLP